MNKATQIGWYTLKEDEVFRNTYECAAWYEDVLVKAGKYPVYVYDLRIHQSDNPKYNRKIDGHVGSASVYMEGVVVSDEFGSLFCGVPISNYDNKKNAGKPSACSMRPYLYDVARSILCDAESPFELFPEYEARPIHDTYCCGKDKGKPFTTHGIYRL